MGESCGVDVDGVQGRQPGRRGDVVDGGYDTQGEGGVLGNRDGGSNMEIRIRAEHVKGWLAAARRGGMAEEKGKAKKSTEEEGEDLWEKVVELT